MDQAHVWTCDGEAMNRPDHQTITPVYRTANGLEIFLDTPQMGAHLPTIFSTYRNFQG